MKYTIFGESHGTAIGVAIENPPSGIVLDWDFIHDEMARRAPGKSPLSTPRREKDQVEILSGIFEGKTTGTPLCAVIRNENTQSKDYEAIKNTPRPSHGDYAGRVRYQNCGDYRGGGHFSGRLTAPLVFAGALAKLILRKQQINIQASVSMVGGCKNPTPEQMEKVILHARQAGDSVGGAVRCTVHGIQAGYGAPDFGYNAEGIFSQYLFSVPAVKAVSFGAGFDFASMRGSEANDAFIWNGNTIETQTNHSGGINGGITNGMPITFEVVFRPTPSIARPQQTVDLEQKKPAVLQIQGRHDPCIVPRAVVVIEAAAALAVCDLMHI